MLYLMVMACFCAGGCGAADPNRKYFFSSLVPSPKTWSRPELSFWPNLFRLNNCAIGFTNCFTRWDNRFRLTTPTWRKVAERLGGLAKRLSGQPRRASTTNVWLAPGSTEFKPALVSQAFGGPIQGSTQ